MSDTIVVRGSVVTAVFSIDIDRVVVGMAEPGVVSWGFAMCCHLVVGAVSVIVVCS